jgi:hypothetical protein
MFLIAFWIAVLSTGTLGTAADYPASLELELQSALELGARDSTDPHLLTKVASLYLDLGVDLYQEKEKRLAAYEEGARFARRALELQEGSAEAHYLYAANLGSAAQLKGVVASALTVSELKAHVRRALELKHDHAPALHMMGMMLEELPWFLGGDGKAALESMKHAVATDPNYASARLDLAKMYLKRHDSESAKQELRTLVALEHPRDRYAWTSRYRPEGLRLLAALYVD